MASNTYNIREIDVHRLSEKSTAELITIQQWAATQFAGTLDEKKAREVNEAIRNIRHERRSPFW